MTNPIFIHENTASGSSLIVIESMTVCGSRLAGTSEVRVTWGRKLGTFSSPKWVGMVVEIRRIRAASRGLPSGGHSQREANKPEELAEDEIQNHKTGLNLQPDMEQWSAIS
jgi:hypothetical protein